MRRKVLIIVENLPVPFDRRVWMEATTLKRNGYDVSVICPMTNKYNKKYENIDGINIYRHPLFEAAGGLQYIVEYITALFYEFILSFKVYFKHGFHVIHACNPPDNIFIIGLFWKIFGVKFIFDHHDLNPELYVAKYNKKDMFYKMLVLLEKFTFRIADVVIATNNSYRNIAIKRGKKNNTDVFVVRSAPRLNDMKPLLPNEKYKREKKYLVGYVGVMGKQEGLEYLLKAAKYIVYEKNRKDIHFLLMGSGNYFDVLVALRDKYQLQKYVEFTGRVSDDFLKEALSTADVCVNTDEYNELNNLSTMNKIVEYMAMKCPIVQFEMKEGKFSAEKASLYALPNDEIDLANKILNITDDKSKALEMAEYGRKRFEKLLAWEYQEPILLKAYNKIFGDI